MGLLQMSAQIRDAKMMPMGGTEAYNDRIELLRIEEYPMLQEQVYLDHAGTTLYANSLLDKFAADMRSNLYGNPHSASTSSQASTARIENVRERVLDFFNADPTYFDVVFVANASAGIKLVTEAFRAIPGGFNYVYHQACHTSLVGVRQEASNSQCINDQLVQDWLGNGPIPDAASSGNTTLFAYPAQSNMDGRRFPLDWSRQIRERQKRSSGRTYTLLDAAAYVSTSPLDLHDPESAPDFVVLSFYKIFGFPDLGALIVRREAGPVLQGRKYFGGGTVDMVVCDKESWHATKTHDLHASLEDGTLPIHNIIALNSAFDVHQKLYGSMAEISKHTAYLSQRLRENLAALRHQNGEPVCTMYSPKFGDASAELDMGSVVAFNLRGPRGSWVSLTEFEKLATLGGFHLRTGGVCNPGGIASALGLEPWEMKRNFSAGFRCGDENDIINGKPTGIIRASLGAMSTLKDVDKLLAFICEYYQATDVVELQPARSTLTPGKIAHLRVEDIIIYPIKSCGGFHIPRGQSWDVRQEGLAWDREWCLVQSASGQVMSQKRYPLMALLHPSINLSSGTMDIVYRGKSPTHCERAISVPLSLDPTLFNPAVSLKNIASRVCGQDISAQRYISADINAFFSNILGVKCVLARFPAGGQGKSMRYAKAHLQKHQLDETKSTNAFSGTDNSSNPEIKKPKILLSNESPILAINSASLHALNADITKSGGTSVSPDVFRANIVIGSEPQRSGPPAYCEDFWSRLRIGELDFDMLGSCRRCHMVCINQKTADKSSEPFATLSKTRRFDGKVFFGTHISRVSNPDVPSRFAAGQMGVKIGDVVQIHQQ